MQPELPVPSREILSANLHSSALTADKEGSTADKSWICRFTNTLNLVLSPRQLPGGGKHRLFSVSSPPSLFCVCIWKGSCSQIFCCFLLLIAEVFGTLSALQRWTASPSRALCCQDPLDGKPFAFPSCLTWCSQGTPRMVLRFANFRAEGTGGSEGSEGQLAQRSAHPSSCRWGRSSFDAAAAGKWHRVSRRWRERWG